MLDCSLWRSFVPRRKIFYNLLLCCAIISHCRDSFHHISLSLACILSFFLQFFPIPLSICVIYNNFNSSLKMFEYWKRIKFQLNLRFNSSLAVFVWKIRKSLRNKTSPHTQTTYRLAITIRIDPMYFLLRL